MEGGNTEDKSIFLIFRFPSSFRLLLTITKKLYSCVLEASRLVWAFWKCSQKFSYFLFLAFLVISFALIVLGLVDDFVQSRDVASLIRDGWLEISREEI